MEVACGLFFLWQRGRDEAVCSRGRRAGVCLCPLDVPGLWTNLQLQLRRSPEGSRLSFRRRWISQTLPLNLADTNSPPARRPRLHTASSLVFSGQSYGLDIIWVIMRSVSLKILDLRMDSKDFSWIICKNRWVSGENFLDYIRKVRRDFKLSVKRRKTTAKHLKITYKSQMMLSNYL